MTTRVEAHLWRALAAVIDVHSRFLAGETGTEDSAHDEETDGTKLYDNKHGINPSTELAEHYDNGDHGGGHHSSFGVHITYEDLYSSVLFFTVVYVMGAVAQKFFRMPSLVGEIFAGIVLGPNLADFVPNPEAFVMLGEVGLILLVLEAGIDIDLTTLKLIGPRGVIIAVVGSILPIGIGMAIAFGLGVDTKGAIAGGAAFGPTSLGIAMNILRAGKIVNTPVGQLIVSAAVIDDMIALIILSQLSALSGPAGVADLVVPIVSALLFLCLGGYLAVYILPPIIDRFVLSRVHDDKKGGISMTIMLAMMLALMPATYYAKASFLMGVFVSGLTFCRSDEVHHLFVRQFKRILQWLMRIFFAASIGFQVPIMQFGNGTVIWQGLVFTLALIGKIATGVIVPNFNQTRKFKDLHLRDCLCTGFSMAAEGEFAFVIAVFSVDNNLISQTLYASIVLAVLLSTIFPPFLLRFTINYYNKRSEAIIKKAAEEEMARRVEIENAAGKIGDTTPEGKEAALREGILAETTYFMCIQAYCNSGWGLLPRIITGLGKLNLEVIDHRSWHPRGVDTTMVNEIFVKAQLGQLGDKVTKLDQIKEKMESTKELLLKVIGQPDAKVRVNRWIPGVVEEVVERCVEKSTTKRTRRGLSVSESILVEATETLERDKTLQTQITKHKSVQEILGIPEAAKSEDDHGVYKKDDGGGGGGGDGGGGVVISIRDTLGGEPRQRQPRRVRQKMRSTPVIGGDLFGESRASSELMSSGNGNMMGVPEFLSAFTGPGAGGGGGAIGGGGVGFGAGGKGRGGRKPLGPPASGHPCDLTVGNETFKIRISTATLNRIRSGFSGGMVEDGSILIASSDVPIENRLQGFVRNQGTLSKITEEDVSVSEGASEVSDTDSIAEERVC